MNRNGQKTQLLHGGFPSWLFEDGKLRELKTSGELKVLLVLGYHANHRTGEAIPSVETIAREAGCSVSTVQRASVKLAEKGIIKRLEGGGRNNTNRYRFPEYQAAKPPQSYAGVSSDSDPKTKKPPQNCDGVSTDSIDYEGKPSHSKHKSPATEIINPRIQGANPPQSCATRTHNTGTLTTQGNISEPETDPSNEQAPANDPLVVVFSLLEESGITPKKIVRNLAEKIIQEQGEPHIRVHGGPIEYTSHLIEVGKCKSPGWYRDAIEKCWEIPKPPPDSEKENQRMREYADHRMIERAREKETTKQKNNSQRTETRNRLSKLPEEEQKAIVQEATARLVAMPWISPKCRCGPNGEDPTPETDTWGSMTGPKVREILFEIERTGTFTQTQRHPVLPETLSAPQNPTLTGGMGDDAVDSERNQAKPAEPPEAA